MIEQLGDKACFLLLAVGGISLLFVFLALIDKAAERISVRRSKSRA